MALFGRESAGEKRRAERIGRWVGARTPYALPAMLFGVLSVVDAVLLLGFVLGPAAVVLGILGQKDISRRQGVLGAKLCATAIALGVAGFFLSTGMFIYYQR